MEQVNCRFILLSISVLLPCIEQILRKQKAATNKTIPYVLHQMWTSGLDDYRYRLRDPNFGIKDFARQACAKHHQHWEVKEFAFVDFLGIKPNSTSSKVTPCTIALCGVMINTLWGSPFTIRIWLLAMLADLHLELQNRMGPFTVAAASQPSCILPTLSALSCASCSALTH